MRIELLPGMTNVLRFPVKRRARPTLVLLQAIAPDVREVLSIAEAFDLEAPNPDLRARVDAETAEHILYNFAVACGTMHAALDALLDPVIAQAVDACRAAHDESVDAAEAQLALLRAQTAGLFWIETLQERVEALTLKTAKLLIVAHARVEEAEGVARAVDLARRGEPWTPRNQRDEENALFGVACKAG